MKINNFFKGLVGVAALGVLSGCSSDYLDLKPESNPSQEDVFATTEGAALAINGICLSMYTQYQGTEWNQFNGEPWCNTWCNDAMGQDYISGLAGAAFGADIVKHESWDNGNLLIAVGPWMFYYNIINQANKVLADIDKAEGTQAERDFIKAQALTFRAHGYSKLLTYFAPRWEDSNNGSSYCLVLRTDPEVKDVPLSTMAQTFDMIYKDLDDAIALYQGANIKREAKFQPDLSIAYGVYARTALTKNDWPKAQEMARKAREGYVIMDAATYLGGFYEDNDDFMWISSSTESDVYYWSWGSHFAANGLYVKNWQLGGGAIDMTLYRELDPNDIRRKCFLTPDKLALLNSINSSWNPGKLKEADFWSKSLVDATKELDLSFGPSKKSGAGRDGKWGLYNSAYFYSKYYLDDVFTGNLSDIPLQNGYHAYYTLSASGPILVAGGKYASLTTTPFGAQYKFLSKAQYGASTYPFMRASEMLLAEAEAAYHNNDVATAQSCLNELNSKRIEGYSCTKTGDALFKEIMVTRRIELWGEGQNFTDFKRWNLPIVRNAWVAGDANSGNWVRERSGEIPVNKKSAWKMPFPLSESRYNNAVDLSLLD